MAIRAQILRSQAAAANCLATVRAIQWIHPLGLIRFTFCTKCVHRCGDLCVGQWNIICVYVLKFCFLFTRVYHSDIEVGHACVTADKFGQL